MTWLSLAESLATGHTARMDCPECGPKKTLIVNHGPQYYSCHCFRCPFKDYKSKGYLTLAQIQEIQRIDALAATELSALELPPNLEYDPNKWPQDARMWLYEASIYGNLIHDNFISYSPRHHRVLLPVYDADDLVFYQARKLRGEGPKYLGPSVDRSSIIYNITPRPDPGNGVVIVVEDILSAIRVGQILPAVSLLGTKITLAQANKLSKYETVVTWLDSDIAGVNGAISVRRAVGLTTNTKNIVTEQDPKLLSNNEIREILKEYL